MKTAAQKKQGRQVSITPSFYAGKPEFQASCFALKLDFAVSLHFNSVRGARVEVNFVPKDFAIKSSLSKKSGGKLSKPPKLTKVFNSIGAGWAELGTEIFLENDDDLAEDLFSRSE